MITDKYSKELLPYLEKALEYENADMGIVHLFCPKTNKLSIAAHIGFEKQFLEHFKEVKPFDNSSFGRAAGVVSTVTINDVNSDIGYASHRNIAKSAGYRSVKSVPVVGKNKQMLGVLSTHFKEPKYHWDTDKVKPVIKEIAKIMHSGSTHCL